MTLSFTALTVVVALITPISGQSATTADNRLKKASTLLEALPDTKALLTTPDKDKNERAAKEIATLRRQFAELVNAYQSASGANGAETEWKKQFSEVERTLARLIGGGSQLPATTFGAAVVVSRPTAPRAGDGVAVAGVPATGAADAAGKVAAVPTAGVAPTAGAVATDAGNVAADPTSGVVATAGAVAAVPGAVGTVGVNPDNPGAALSQDGRALPQDNGANGDTLFDVAAAKVSMIGLKDLDSAIRKQLEQFRIELELFYTAPAGEGRKG